MDRTPGMSASRRRAAKAPLPGDAVHLGQVLHELRVVTGEVRGFPIPAHPTPVVKVMIKQGIRKDRVQREAQAIRIIRAAHAAGLVVSKGRGTIGFQTGILADKLGIDRPLAEKLLMAYVQV